MKTRTETVGAFEAKNRFSELLDRVGKGAEIVITKHDRPIARLVPAAKSTYEERKKRTEEFREMRKRKGYSLEGLSIRELIDEGRR